jgi:hypothetical protein
MSIDPAVLSSVSALWGALIGGGASLCPDLSHRGAIS